MFAIEGQKQKNDPHIQSLMGYLKNQHDGRKVKKALAVKLSYQGYGYEEIVTILGVSLGSVSNWRKAYEEKGLEGFEHHHNGRKSYLTKEEREEVKEWLEKKAIWTLNELECYLIEKYDVVYESRQSYYNLFEEAGYSWKKTSKVNPKADEEEVARKKPKSQPYWRVTGLR